MSLLQMSLSGAALILSIILIRAAAINRLPKKTFFILWWISILRLLIPISIPSVFSVYSLIRQNHTAHTPAETPVSNFAAVMQGEFFELTGEQSAIPVPVIHASVWLIIWIAGMVFCAAFFTFSYLRCRLEFSMSLPVQNAFAEKWLKEHQLMRPISIRQSDRISAPLTYGFFKPVILMPRTTDWKNTRQLQYIFLHEYVHIRRFDPGAKLISTLALCVHWFNPLVWIMYILFNRDIELACDERVVQLSGESSKKEYALMLINMEARKSGFMPFCNEFSKNAIEERITAIMKTKRTTMTAMITTCLVVFAAINIFATSAPPIPSPESKGNTMTIIHERVELLHYENGWPYLHDVLTNHTDKTITETEYCMLAYDENGTPLKLHWNIFDASQKKRYAYLVRTDGLNIKPNQTENYHGGWSLYDGEVMDQWPVIGDGEANPVVYSLFCLKQVVFDDGTIWNNSNYHSWFEAYAGKEIKAEDLQNYYPYTYEISFP